MARRAQSAPAVGDDGAISSVFSAIRDKGQHELGGQVSIGSDAEADLVGLSLPALCLRYLFQSTVYPLSRIAQITGEEGCAKSALLSEIIRWHCVHGGGGVIGETENKDTEDFRKSILKWKPEWLGRVLAKPAYSLEQWQDILTTFVALFRTEQDRVGGPGRTMPVCFGIDSIMAVAPQSEIDAVLKDGHASRGFALAANLIARYMRTMPIQIQKYPFSVVGTNHLKPAVDPMGRPISNIPGGKAVKFMETYEIEMRKAANGYDIDKLEYGGLRIQLIAKKNSLGPSRKSITAELLWWWERDENGEMRQQSVWDWDNATIEMIAGFETQKGKKTLYNALRDITGIQVVDKSQRLACSPILGVPKQSPIEYRALGALLEQRPDLLAMCYEVLGISVRKEFQPGMDYMQTVRAAREEARASTAALYENVENMPVISEPIVGDVPVEVDALPGEEDENE